MIDTQKLESEFSKDIARLNRMSQNILTMNTVEYAYSRLMELQFAATIEFFLEVDALTTGLVVCYGRLFTESEGSTKLKEKKIPTELRATHDDLMALRHKRYAHHGAHPTVKSKVSLEAHAEGVILNQQMQIGFWVGAPKHWAPLFAWLRGYIYTMINDELGYLSEKSGIKWVMQQGDAPAWSVEN